MGGGEEERKGKEGAGRRPEIQTHNASGPKKKNKQKGYIRKTTKKRGVVGERQKRGAHSDHVIIL